MSTPTEVDFAKRKQELLDGCKLDSTWTEELLPRLDRFLQPYLPFFGRKENRQHAHTVVRGFLSELENKNLESIAYHFGQNRLPIQRFVGTAEWDSQAAIELLVQQVGQSLGEEDGILVFDPTSFPKTGTHSVGVQRQWCGRLGKVENCQLALGLGYVSRQEQALVDLRLYLPESWARDKQRRKKAGVPKGIKFKTRHQMALDLIEEHGEKLPHRWITGDDEMGQPYWFRQCLRRKKEQYLFAVPSNTLIRDLETDPPEPRRRNQTPQRPWQAMDQFVLAQDNTAWIQLEVRDGSKGPLTIHILKRRVATRNERRKEGDEEVLIAIRYDYRDDSKTSKTDYYLSNADVTTELTEFARVAKAEPRIEECFRRAKTETGLADYEVRKWGGWHRHVTLSLLASWFLVTQTLEGKKNDPSDYTASGETSHRRPNRAPVRMRFIPTRRLEIPTTDAKKRTGSLLSLETT